MELKQQKRVPLLIAYLAPAQCFPSQVRRESPDRCPAVEPRVAACEARPTLAFFDVSPSPQRMETLSDPNNNDM